MFAFGAPRRPRRPSLTPMIDVVFLLLVFFMLAARFDTGAALPLSLPSGTGAAYSGPPRLVEVTARGVMLNGAPLPEAGLVAALAPLMQGPDDTIVLRPRAGAGVQDVVTVIDRLRGAGFTALTLVE